MENDALGTLVIDGLNTSALDRAQLVRLREGGVSAFHWTVARAQAGWEEVIASIESAWAQVQALGGEVEVVGSAEELRRVVAEGRVAAIFGLQDTRALETDLSRVWTLRRLGLRVLQLTYNERNFVGDGCTEPANAGLSLFGRRLVGELNAARILIDLSHCGRQTTLDAVALSRVPVAITHANARALCDTPRNKTDAEIRAVAEAGGIVGTVFWSPLSGAGRRPTVDSIVKHLAHIVKVGGNRSPSIGSDWGEGVFASAAEWERNLLVSEKLYPSVTAHVGDWYRFETRNVEGLESISKLPNLARQMRAEGFSAVTIAGTLGENFLRVFQSACG
jgi:membrane dipeptidase